MDEIAATREPLLAAATEDGITHRLWALTDPAGQAAIAADLAPRQALIADGHHRYAAYLELQARRRAAGDQAGPWDNGLALLVDTAAYPPRIGAMHRVIPGLPPADAAALAKAAFTVRAVPAGLPAALCELAEAGRYGPAFLIAGGGELHLLEHPGPGPDGGGDARRALAGLACAARIGPAAAPHRAAVAGPATASARCGSCTRTRRPRYGRRMRPAGRQCSPTRYRPAEVRDIAGRGEQMPPKSTSFGPKARTGLLIRTFGYG